LIRSAPIATVEYFEAALPFASNHDLGMPITQFDLTKPAGSVDLAEDYRRASLRPSRRPTGAGQSGTQKLAVL
jgi:hypothetical protein